MKELKIYVFNDDCKSYYLTKTYPVKTIDDINFIINDYYYIHQRVKYNLVIDDKLCLFMEDF